MKLLELSDIFMLLDIEMDNDTINISIDNNQNLSFSTDSHVSVERSPSTSSQNSLSLLCGSPSSPSNEYSCKKIEMLMK